MKPTKRDCKKTVLNTHQPPETLPVHRVISAAKSLIRHSRELVRHEREVERATGAHFNLFQIFGVGHYEVSTHSPLLADLLNPDGSHGQGAAFLNCFLKTIESEHSLSPYLKTNFNPDSARVHLEYSLGPRTEISGGRLDILIVDKAGLQIAIENKIYAVEQENWVRRYRHDLRENDCLIYLTLNGDAPIQIDEGAKDKVICISYATTITRWLTACRKEVATVPIVRESLTQYIHLIQNLTHQNLSNRMNEEIIRTVLDNDENFRAFCALRDANMAVRGKVIRDLGDRIRKKISERVPLGFKVVSTPTGNCTKSEAFYFSTPELESMNLVAAIEFDAHDYGQCFYGFGLGKPDQLFDEKSPAGQILIKHFTETFGTPQSSNSYWPAWRYWTARQRWDDEVFQTIAFRKEQFDHEIMSIIEHLLAVAKGSFSRELSNLERPQISADKSSP
ncbi:MAG: PD-(D/E)XK nuclease family protein [Opitutales bacterium]